MWDSSVGFSLIVSTIITFINYITTRTKSKTEQELKDKQNDMIILFVVTFTVLMFGKICFGSLPSTSGSTVASRVVETKGGQCPF